MKVLILAAGFGSRMKGFYDMPKSMIDIGDGDTTLNELLKYLTIDKFIESITVVTGYKRELIYDFVKSNYPAVRLINNPRYADTSNAISLRLGFLQAEVTAEDEVLIIDADTYLSKEAFNEIITYTKNCKDIGRSTIFTTRSKRAVGEWAIRSNEFGYITSIYDVTEDNANDEEVPSTSGITYFSALGLKTLMSKLYTMKIDKSSYWDDIYKENFNAMSLKVHELSGFIYEIDYPADVDRLRLHRKYDNPAN